MEVLKMKLERLGSLVEVAYISYPIVPLQFTVYVDTTEPQFHDPKLVIPSPEKHFMKMFKKKYFSVP